MMRLWRLDEVARPAQRLLHIVAALALGFLLFLWLVLAVLTVPAHADTLCVKPGGGDGCLATISAALLAAQENDTIRVSAGVYTENVLISQTVTVQGGWSPDFSARDVDAYLSVILPADNSQSVVAIQGDFADTSLVAPTLDGFVITGGRADLGSNHGGGLRIVDSNAVVISNTIQNNVAFLLGGGVWVQRGAPMLQGNHIVDNLSVGLGQDAHGGGVQLENSEATLLDNMLARNVVSGTEAFGGGLEVTGSGAGAVTLQRNLFISNTALTSPGALPQNDGFGGAIAVRYGQVVLENSRLFSNTAATGGGAVFLGGSLLDCCKLTAVDTMISANVAFQGGGIFIGGTVDDCCQFNGTNLQIQRNAATHGGGLYNVAQWLALRGSLIFSNTAAVNGGGLLLGPGAVFSFTHSAAIANQAGADGGGIYNSGLISVSTTTVSGNSAGDRGGGIANFNVVDLASVTVADNTSANGAGFFNASVVNTINSLFALNAGDNCLGALFSLGHNLEDGATCALGQPTDMSNTPPDMGPLADNGGATPTHALEGDSAAIDAADDAACGPADQRGVPRPLDGDGDGQAVCDIGAFEFQGLGPYLPLVRRD